MKKLNRLFFLNTLLVIFFAQFLVAQGVILREPIYQYNIDGADTQQDQLFHLRAGETYTRSLDFEEAFRSYDIAVSLDPQSALALIQRAIFYKRFGMTDAARQDYEKANRLNPFAADLYGYNGTKGKARVLLADPIKSMNSTDIINRMELFAQAMDRHVVNGRIDAPEMIIIDRIISLIEKDELDEALTESYSLKGNDTISSLKYALLGVIHLQQEKTQEAVTVLKKATKLAPSLTPAWHNLALAHQAQKKYTEAKAYYNKAIRNDNVSSTILFSRAQLHKAQKNWDEAIRDYDKIIDSSGDQYIDAYLNRGLTKKLNGDFKGALADINYVIDHLDPSAELLLNRGNLYFSFGFYNQAVIDYSAAIDIDSSASNAYHNRAMAILIVNNVDKACEDLSKSAELGSEEASEKIRYFCTL